MSEDGKKFAFVEGAAAYVVDVSGSTPSAAVKVSGAGVPGSSVAAPTFSPDGTRLAYIADAVTDEKFELYVVDLSGAVPGAAEKASGALVSDGDVEFAFGACQFAPNGKKLAYVADATTDNVFEAFVVDVSGPVPGPARKVNDTLVEGGDVFPGTFLLRFSPDSRFVAYAADQRTNDAFEWFLSDISQAVPGTPQRVTGAFVPGGQSLSLSFAPDGSGLAYSATQRDRNVQELFYVDLRGRVPASPVLVNGDLVAGGNVQGGFAFSRDGRKLGYVADQIVDERGDLFMSDVSSGVPRTAPVATNTLQEFVVTGDSASFVWKSPRSGGNDIWFADVSGTAPSAPARVNTSPVNSIRVLTVP